MKLQELGASRKTQQLSRTFESQTGQKFDFGQLSAQQARHMLRRVGTVLKEYRSSPRMHMSERDAGYLKLAIMEQGLRSRLAEIEADPASATSAKKPVAPLPANAKAVMDKVKRRQALTPDEQKVMNMVALATESRRLVREQNELHQAQVVLAAQDMIDRIQGMIEDVSEMQFKDLPALVASIKSDIGVDQAQQFQNDATQSLGNLLQSMQQNKTEMEAAQGVLTGQAPIVPGQDDAGMDDMESNDDLGAELDLDANIDVDDEESPGSEQDLGRARR